MSEKKEPEEAITAITGILFKCGKDIIDSLLYLDGTILDRQLVYHIMGEQHVFVAHENSQELACIIQKFLAATSRTPEEKEQAEREQAELAAQKEENAQKARDALKEFVKTHAMPLPPGADDGDDGDDALGLSDLIMANPLTKRGPVGAAKAKNKGPRRSGNMPHLGGTGDDTIIIPISDDTPTVEQHIHQQKTNQQINPVLANKQEVPIVTQPSYVPKRGRPRKNDVTRMANIGIINKGANVPQQVVRCPKTGRPIVLRPKQVHNMPVPGPAGRGAPSVINANARTNVNPNGQPMPIPSAAGRGVPVNTPANANFNARTMANPGVAVQPINPNQTSHPIPADTNPGVTIVPITDATTIANANAGTITNSTATGPVLQKANIAPPQPQPQPIKTISVNNNTLQQQQQPQQQVPKQPQQQPAQQQQQQNVPQQLEQQQPQQRVPQQQQPQQQRQRVPQQQQPRQQPQQQLQQHQKQQQQKYQQQQHLLLQQQPQQPPKQQPPKQQQMNFVRKLVKLDSKDMALITQLQNLKKHNLLKNQEAQAQKLSNQVTVKDETKQASEAQDVKKPNIEIQENIIVVPGVGDVTLPGHKRKRTNPAKPGLKPKVPKMDNLEVKGVDDDVIVIDIEKPHDANLKSDVAQINEPAESKAETPPLVHTCNKRFIGQNSPSGRGRKRRMHGTGVNQRGPNAQQYKAAVTNWKKEVLESDDVPSVKFNIKHRPSKYQDNKPPLECETDESRKANYKRKLAAKAKWVRRLDALNVKAKNARRLAKKAHEMHILEELGDIINENLAKDEPNVIPIIPSGSMPRLDPFIMPNYDELPTTSIIRRRSPVNVTVDIIRNNPKDEDEEEMAVGIITDDEDDEEEEEADAKPEKKKEPIVKPEKKKDVAAKAEKKKKQAHGKKEAVPPSMPDLFDL